MAFYELIFSVHERADWTTLSVGGMHALARAAQLPPFQLVACLS